jgi:putative membrane protein
MRTIHAFSRLGMLCAAGLLAGGVALAQANPGGGAQQTNPGQPQQQQPGSTGTASSGANPSAGPGQQQDYASQSFVSKAMEGNDAEIQMAQVAEQKSQSADVKQYAQKLASEHQQMNDKWLKPVAQQMGMSEPKGPSKKDKKEMAKLDGLSGQQFDTQYIQMMVTDHQKDLKAYQDEAKSAQNPSVQQIAQQGTKVIQQHLDLAEQLAKNHNVPVAEKEVSSK